MEIREPVLARAPRVLWREGPGCVLVRRVGDEALELTGMAEFVWRELAAPTPFTQLEAAVADAAGLGGSDLDAELAGTLDAAVARLTADHVISQHS